MIRKAVIQDLETILSIYADARRFMEENGNPTQWQGGYPPQKTLEEDISRGRLYVYERDDDICGVFYYMIENDPTYAVIEDGSWLNDEPYGVVHRIAVKQGKRGAGSACLEWALLRCGNLRIDTHEDNRPMQNLLNKLGYTRCGIIHLLNGDPRIAFQKTLKEKEKNDEQDQ